MKLGGCAILGLAAVALLAVVWLTHRPRTYRYKMIVEVNTPAGPRSGSVVREVEWARTLPLLTANEFSFRQRGEAVAIDLPDGSVLFVLLHWDGYETIRAGFGQARKYDVKTELDTAQENRRVYEYPTIETARTHNLVFPRFVKFRDLSDPASVHAVDPANIGNGVTFRRITMQMTDEPVTNSIQRRLPWLPNYYSMQFSGDRFSGTENQHKGLSSEISSGDFAAGLGLSPYERGHF